MEETKGREAKKSADGKKKTPVIDSSKGRRSLNKSDKLKKSKGKKNENERRLSRRWTTGVTSTPKSKKQGRGRSESPKVPSTPNSSEIDHYTLVGEDEEFSELPENIPNEPPKTTVQDICGELLEEFRKEAWEICMERFTMVEGRDLILYELRDTWLRIMRCEWMDETRVTQEALPASFFLGMRDDPPLPLTFDFWAKGTLEEFPNARRESVLDPFVRGTTNSNASVDIGGGDGFSQDGSDPRDAFKSAPASKANSKTSLNRVATASGVIKKSTSHHTLAAGDIGQQERKIALSKDLTAKKSSSTSMIPSLVKSTSSTLQSTSSAVRGKEITTIKSAVSIKSSKSFQYQKYGLKPWTVSQCGGRDGTNNVFRLVNQTTSEALAHGHNNDTSEQTQLLDSNATDEDPDNEKELESETLETLPLSANDEDTETLFEGLMNNENDLSPESLSNVPSELDFAKDANVPHLPFVDNANKRKTPLHGRKSAVDPKTMTKEAAGDSGLAMKQDTQHKPNLVKYPKPVSSKRNLVLRKIKTTPFVSTAGSKQNLKEYCKPQDNEVMKNRLAIAKIRNDLIQQHRNSLRHRLSSAQ